MKRDDPRIEIFLQQMPKSMDALPVIDVIRYVYQEAYSAGFMDGLYAKGVIDAAEEED